MHTLNEKQIQILHVAEKLFGEKGFDGTSVRNIAKEAGINIAMVSYYFGSKEKMLESLILYRSNATKMELDTLAHQDLSPLEKLDKLVELYISRVHKNRCLYQIVHFELANNHRDLDFNAFIEVKKRNVAMVEQIVKQGQDAGVFRKDVNIALIPPTVIGLIFQFHTNREMYAEMFNLKSDAAFNHYIKNELTAHIKQTIKALLTHEV